MYVHSTHVNYPLTTPIGAGMLPHIVNHQSRTRLVQIRIRQHSFDISEPFAEGHRLTPPEAAALNSLRAENIRNNAARRLAGLKSPLGPEALAQFVSWLDRYDWEYKFAERAKRAGGAGGGAPFDRALRAIATREARVMANRQGRDLAGAELESAIQALMGLSELQAEAASQVSAAQEVAQEALEDMLAGEE